MKVFESIVNKNLLDKFENPRGATLMNHAQNTCNIENVISICSMLYPEIIEVNDCIFISDFYYRLDIESLEKQFKYDKRAIERWVNAWSLAGLSSVNTQHMLNNDVCFDTLGELLKYFWSRRLNELFPNREFIFEIGMEIEGENGLSITFYQK